ncbi:MAG: A/G-specific adenine glycosylase [Burkholderiaceae bacterium]
MASRVVRWQQIHGRNNLPWQATRDPYRVWLSEIMLQQTQVATVVVYFRRFTERMPTLASLAAASEDEVLALWSGLGYYSRARNLHRCAITIVEQHGGVFPGDPDTLVKLPGIGRSTAAAISSLCFGARAAVLDANVRRVLTRLVAFDRDVSVSANGRALWDIATGFLPQRNLARSMPRYTQGMMDLGATVCLARNPLCESCPLADLCVAGRSGTAESFPVKTRKLRRSTQSIWLLCAQDIGGATWLERRPSSGIWGGLYCLPWFDSREALADALSPPYRTRLRDLEPVKHVLTHKDLYLHPVIWTVPNASVQKLRGTRFTVAQWTHLGLPAPVRTLLRQVCSQPNEVTG